MNRGLAYVAHDSQIDDALMPYLSLSLSVGVTSSPDLNHSLLKANTYIKGRRDGKSEKERWKERRREGGTR